MTEIIVFEGVESSGKSTQARKLRERLEHRGLDIDFYREPGGTDLGESIRSILLDPETKICTQAERHGMLTARAQLFQEIQVTNNDVTILDRGPLSTWAYQVHGGDHGSQRSKQQFYRNRKNLPITRIHNYIIDVSLETSLERQRGTDQDRIEQRKKAYHERVLQGYNNRPNMYTYTRFDGERPIDAVAQSVFKDFLTRHVETPDENTTEAPYENQRSSSTT